MTIFKLNYYSHILLTSKYSFIIKLAICLSIYLLFYADSIYDIAYCTKKTESKIVFNAAGQRVHVLDTPLVEATAVPIIAESKEDVVRGIQGQLRAMQLDSKAKHDEILARLDEIKRIQTESKQVLPKSTISNTTELIAEKQELIDEVERLQRIVLDRRTEASLNRERITSQLKQIEELQEINRILTNPGEVPIMESKSTQTNVTYPNKRYAKADFDRDLENPWYKEDTKNAGTRTNIKQNKQQDCDIA